MIVAEDVSGSQRVIRGPVPSTRAIRRRAYTISETDRDQDGGQPHAERDDQEEPEPDAVQRHRAQQHDEGGRARDDAAGEAQRETGSRSETVVPRWHVVMMAMSPWRGDAMMVVPAMRAVVRMIVIGRVVRGA